MIWEACTHGFQSHVMRSLLNTAVCIFLVAGCASHRQAARQASDLNSGNPESPRQVYELLKQTDSEPILLQGRQGRTVIVAPKLVGRVMCAGFDGLEGKTNAYVNAEQISKGFSKVGPGSENDFGGEERIWFAPEGGKYGFFWEPGAEQNWKNYMIFWPMHSLQYKVTRIAPDRHWVVFSAPVQLTNYQGHKFNLDITRRISVLDWCPFTDGLGRETEFTGFQSETWAQNTGKESWDKQSSPISLWTVGQFNCRKHTVVMLPFKEGLVKEPSKPITTEYFRSHGAMPDNYWAVKPGCGLLKVNGDFQTKLEMQAGWCLGRLGSIDLETSELTVVEFQLYPELSYTASFLLPYEGDLLNGGAMSSFVSKGPIGSSIYELETCSPIMELAPGQSFLHLCRTYHIRGQREAIDKICQRYFNIDMKTLEAFDQQARKMPPELDHRNVDAKKINYNNWIDWSLPRSVSVAPFEGERYEVEVPDTIDLVDHANYALNMATRLWAPEWGYELLNSTDMSTNPPKFSMGSGGLLTESAKITEAIPMLRVMTGSTYNIDMDEKAMMSFVRVTGEDGLCYYPVENRPWAFFDDYTKTIGKPYSDIFAEGRQLLAYASWYQHDKNPLWKELAEKKTHRLLEMTLKKNDTFYFRLLRGYTPWDDPKKGEVVPLGDHNVYDRGKGMVGTPAACIVGWIPQAGGIWYRLTQEGSFRKLSEGLAKYLYLYGEMIDPNTGKYLADHETHITHSLLSNLSWALTFDDKQMAQWVKRGYDFHLSFIDPCQLGILFDQEACMVSDTIGIGIMLTQAGMGDYWEEVDRLIRNTYLDMQVTNVKWLKSKPFKYLDNLEPGDCQFEDGADRCVGVWRQYLNEDYKEAAGCCNGNCSRELYYVWSNIITADDGKLRVNLLLNRASQWADVDSWLPYEGRVAISMKTAKDALLVRVPEWVDQHKVDCKVNGEKRKVSWSGNYLDVGAVNCGDKVCVEFPMKRRTVDATIPVLLKREGEEETWEQKKCTVALKGNTVISLEPGLKYPLAQHEKYEADKAPMKKMTRFVSKEKFLF